MEHLRRSGEAVLWGVKREGGTGGASTRFTILRTIGERSLNLLPPKPPQASSLPCPFISPPPRPRPPLEGGPRMDEGEEGGEKEEEEVVGSVMNCVPYEVCLYMFSFLDPRTVLTAGRVCTSWHLIASDLSLWKHLYEHSLHLHSYRLGHANHLHPPPPDAPSSSSSSCSFCSPSSGGGGGGGGGGFLVSPSIVVDQVHPAMPQSPPMSPRGPPTAIATATTSVSSSTTSSTITPTTHPYPTDTPSPSASCVCSGSSSGLSNTSATVRGGGPGPAQHHSDGPPSSSPTGDELESGRVIHLAHQQQRQHYQHHQLHHHSYNPEGINNNVRSSRVMHVGVEDDVEVERRGVGDTIFADEKEIRSGSLGRLVERLVAEKPPESYVSVFLMTYRTFTTPVILLMTLLALYQRADGSSSGGQEEISDTWFPFPPHDGERSVITIEEEADIRALKFRICNILKIWMDEYFEDFRGDPPLLSVLITFILGKLIREGRDTLANILKTSIYNQFHAKQLASKMKRLSSSEMMDTTCLSPPKPKLGKMSLSSPRLSLTDISEEEVARQLTLIEHSLISKLKVHDLLNSRGKPDVINAVNYCNKLSLWVVATVLHQPTPRARAKMKARFITVALHLRNLNNFNGLLTVVGALESPIISRLLETHAELKRKRSSLVKIERELLALAQSARELNKELLASPKLPGIPSLAMCLSQLSLINNLHSDTFEGLINFVKRQLYCTEVLFPFREYQRVPYNLVPVSEIQALLNRGVNTSYNESDLYALSLSLEPPEKDQP